MSAIAQLLAAMDDAAWEALGSKGLLRRATKELEKGVACETVEDTPFALTMRVGDCTVTIPRDGPAKAKCSCSAPGCCHHLIAAGLVCRRATASAPVPEAANPIATAAPTDAPAGGLDSPPAPPEQALLALDFSVLKRWSGAATWRAAVRFLAAGVTIETSAEGSVLVVQLPPTGIQCRFLAGAGLDGAIVSGGEAKARPTYITAAVIGVKARHGQPLPEDQTTESVLAEEKGAPRNRAEVLTAARELIELAIAAGLSHIGAASAERFATLAVSADGTNLPRLARLLKTAAEELGLLAIKHGRADTEAALDALASAYALVAALEKITERPPAHLVGEHRASYVEMHALDLTGITAFPWRARSGYRGVTVLFWEAAAQRWATWSEARSLTVDPRFDPLQAFDNDSPWEAGVPLRALAGSHLRLTRARRSGAGRLSSAQTCKAKVMGAADLRRAHFGPAGFSSWATLREHVAKTTVTGLRAPAPLVDWVVLTPQLWNERVFDRVQQRLLWSIADEAGEQLSLVLPYSDMTAAGVERLEQWEPPANAKTRVVGRLLRRAGELAVEPVALIPANGTTAFHLLVPEPKAKPAAGLKPSSNRPLIPASSDTEDELEEESNPETAIAAYLPAFRAARDALTRLAEAGANGKINPRQEEATLAVKLADAGLPVLSTIIAPVNPMHPDFAPALLKATYVLQLHEQCATGAAT